MLHKSFKMKTMKLKSLLFIGLISLIFSISANGQVPERKGWWKFDDPGNLLKAEIGSPLEVVGNLTSVEGPAASNKAVLVPMGNYLVMTHNIGPNGGGSFVNEYSLQIDFSLPEAGKWHSFFQTAPANTNDADFFTNASNSLGVAATGYSAKGVAAETWYRLVISVKNGEFFKVYVDGSLWHEGSVQPVDGRFSLESTLLLFADEDGEDNPINCSEAGIWDVALDESQVSALGGADNARVPVRTKMGWWKFDDPSNLLKAEIGQPLQLIGSQQSVEGPEPGNLATKLEKGSYLKMLKGILPLDGDTLVNEYSIQMDFLIPEEGVWHAFLQTDSTNTSDADLFTNRDNAIGTLVTGYTENTISKDTWYRMVITVKNGEFFNIYVNGELWLESAGQEVNGRFALTESLLRFADDDGEDNTVLCSEISIWEVALTDLEVTDLGIDPANTLPERMGWWKFDDMQNIYKAEVGFDLIQHGTVSSISGPFAQNYAVEVGLGSYLEMIHGMYGNGDGFMVNDYTLLIDFLVPEVGIWHAFFQTDPTNGGDADLFTNVNNSIGTSATSYSTETISANTWYRMVVTVKNGYFFKIFLDGKLFLNSAGQTVDGRFALAENLLLFADNDGDDGIIRCAEVSIWDKPLTDAQVAKLGNATTIPTAVNDIKIVDRGGLGQNFPNPFSGSTRFKYQVTETGPVSFHLFDITGKEIKVIREGVKPAGNYVLDLNAGNLLNGVYFVQMKTINKTSTRKIIVRQ